MNFQGATQTSDKKKKTVFPVYYQTLIFDNIVIPDYNNFAFANQVCLRLYDSDLDGDDYLGTTFFNLKDAVITPDPDDPLPDPVWRSFFFEVPGDSQGDVLMQVQLIPTFGKPVSKVAKVINVSIHYYCSDANVVVVFLAYSLLSHHPALRSSSSL